MNLKSFTIGTLVGGIAFFLLGFIFYGTILVDFFQQNSGSATGITKEEPSFLSLFLGEIAFGALYTYIFLQWANIRTFASGAKGGAVIGLLLGLGYNLINFGVNNIMTFTGHLTDTAVSLFSGAIAGGVIGWVLGKTD